MKEYDSRGWAGAWLTLTNQRLIVQRFFGKPLSYPLSRVTQIIEYDYWPPLVAFFPHKILRIDLDNGGSLLLGMLGLQIWMQEIQRLQAGALHLPYTTAPSTILHTLPNLLPDAAMGLNRHDCNFSHNDLCMHAHRLAGFVQLMCLISSQLFVTKCSNKNDIRYSYL